MTNWSLYLQLIYFNNFVLGDMAFAGLILRFFKRLAEAFLQSSPLKNILIVCIQFLCWFLHSRF